VHKRAGAPFRVLNPELELHPAGGKVQKIAALDCPAQQEEWEGEVGTEKKEGRRKG